MTALRGVGIGALVAWSLISVGGCAMTPTTPGQSSDKSPEQIAKSCMADLGWSLTISSDGGMSSEYPIDQEENYNAALDGCMSTADAPSFEDLSTDEVKTAYTAQVKTLECLRGLGIGLDDPPSFQTYLDSRAQWSPYLEIETDILHSRFTELEKECPQVSLQ